MKLILLAAGFGTRLRPITDTVPKCLVDISGKPLLAYWLDKVNASSKVDELLINTHYLSDMVVDFVQNYELNVPVRMFHEDQLLGTARTVRANAEWLSGESFILAHADNFSTLNLDALCADHESRPVDCVMTMLSFRTDTPETCGVLELDEDCRVQNFYEKLKEDHGNLANGAVYVCEPEILTDICSRTDSELCFSNDIIPHYMGRIFSTELNGHHIDIGNIPALEKARAVRV